MIRTLVTVIGVSLLLAAPVWAQPFDGNGRYKLMTDDGVRGKQGLSALAERFSPKPYDLLGDGQGNWASERVVFRDVDTGTQIIRLTNDPFTDQLSYFQGNWSADGRYIVFRRRPGMWEASTATHGPMAMNADGTNLRSVFRDVPMVEALVCSPTQPDVCFSMPQRKQLVAYSISTGKPTQVLRPINGGWHLKISLDGRYLINRGPISDGQKGIWIVGTDGKEYYEFPLPEPIHDSYRINPARKKVMFWYEGKFGSEGFVECNFDGSDKKKINVQFDWNHGDVGLDRGVHTGGYITRMTADGWEPTVNLFGAPQVHGDEGMVYDDPPDHNGYSSWLPKDRPWAYHTKIIQKPFISELEEWAVDPAPDQYVNRYRICYTGMSRGRALDCPNASPDGTKVLFNSDMLGSVNIYCAVARLPETPLSLKVATDGNGAKLTWSPPAHHAETAGYHVYRSDESGVNFKPITDTPVTELQFTDSTPGTHFYAVTAVEYGGLESPLSNEATLAAGGKRRIYLEAEPAKLSPEIWAGFGGSASNLRYLWMRKKEGIGRATLPLVDKPAVATVWARVKGKAGAEFSITAGGATAMLSAKPTDNWQWNKAGATLPLADATALEITSRTYGSAIDALVLTDDPSFDPAHARRVDLPPLTAVADAKADAGSPYVVKLSWSPAGAATFDHYNVYCGSAADFSPDQRTLVASPKQPSAIDWGLRPGQSYRYVITAVDRAGNEGPPSSPLAVTTPAIKPVKLEKEFAPSLSFDVAEPGTYAVWLHVVQQDGPGAQYIDVKVDNTGGGSWVGGNDTAKYNKTYWLNYDRWGRFDLKAGPHTLTINNKTANKIDKVTITNDLSYRPSDDHVTALGGW